MSKDNQKIHAIARREVILSAGAIGSPKLLMLSGVGPASHLQDMNINVIKDAPVGKNLMDHITYWGLNVLVNDSVTIVTNKFFDPTNNDLADYFTTRKGPLTVIGGVESVVFLKVDEMNSRRGWPDMELLMTGTSVGSDMLAHIALAVNSEHNDKFFKPMRDKESFMIMPTLLRPKSRGEIMLKSKNPNDHPRIIPNYFSHPDDMRKMILGIREAINLIRTRAMQKYDAKLPEYSVPGCENFQRESDEYWECAVRTFADTLWHPSGTCKMGARNDPSTVVDPRLRVLTIFIWFCDDNAILIAFFFYFSRSLVSKD